MDSINRSLRILFLALCAVVFGSLIEAKADTVSIVSNFNGTPIAAGNTIYFNSVFKATGLSSSAPTTISLTNASFTFSANGTNYNLAVPNATITFSPNTTTAMTTFNAPTNTFNTSVPQTGAGNDFLTALIFKVPAGGLPGGIDPVTFTGTFSSNTPGVSLSFQWAAGVYNSSFSSDYNALGIKPVDDNGQSQYNNSDHAGTPENFTNDLVGGARGGAGSNFTGSYSATGHSQPGPQTTPTPEPATLFLLGSGLAGVASRVRKMRKSRNESEM